MGEGDGELRREQRRSTVRRSAEPRRVGFRPGRRARRRWRRRDDDESLRSFRAARRRPWDEGCADLTRVCVAKGPMVASIYRCIPSDSIEFDTPNGALIPQAAGTYRVWVDPTDNST